MAINPSWLWRAISGRYAEIGSYYYQSIIVSRGGGATDHDDAGAFRRVGLAINLSGVMHSLGGSLEIPRTHPDSIRVSRAVTNVAETGMLEGPTKNHANRTVPIPKFLAPMLKADIEGRDNGHLVFPSPRNGGWLPLGEFRWAFDKAVAAVKLGDFVPQELRHT